MTEATTVNNALAIVKTIFDLPGSPGVTSLSGIVKETYDWIVREKISLTLFDKVKALAGGRAYPNSSGNELHNAIQKADHEIGQKWRVPINLVRAGSLGRLLTQDEGLRYIVTTHAALSRTHPNEYTVRLLCAMTFDRGGHEEGIEPYYSWEVNPMLSVISKMVDSVDVHVRNVGLNLSELPEPLRQMHRHTLDHETFAAIIMAIQRTDSDIFISCAQFLYDLVSWLLYHFDGEIDVSVDGQVVHHQDSERGSRRKLIYFCSGCTKAWEACDASTSLNPVSCGTMTADGLRSKPLVYQEQRERSRPQDFTRMPFYDRERLSNAYWQSAAEPLTTAEWKDICAAAQGIAAWMLREPISPSADHGLVFATAEPTSSSGAQLSDILHSHPGLMTMKTGSRAEKMSVYETPDAQMVDESDDQESLSDQEDANPDGLLLERDLEDIIDCFPHVSGVVKDMRKRCNCRVCEDSGDLSDCKIGCVGHAATTMIFVLIAHAVADAFGARDASGTSDLSDLVEAASESLAQLMFNRCIDWEIWFRVVACVVTGVGWDDLVSARGDISDGNYTTTALQAGSLVIAASWLDMEEVHTWNGCFKISTVQGTIEGVSGDLGLVWTEGTAFGSVISTGVPSSPTPTLDDLSAALELDSCSIKRRDVIFHKQGIVYRMMTVFQCGDRLSIIDPAQALRTSLSAKLLQCEHARQKQPQNPNRQASLVREDIEVSDMGQVLVGWRSYQSFPKVRMTRLLDSALKTNIALSSTRPVIAHLFSPTRCCLGCLSAMFKPEKCVNIIAVEPVVLDHKPRQLTKKTRR